MLFANFALTTVFKKSMSLIFNKWEKFVELFQSENISVFTLRYFYLCKFRRDDVSGKWAKTEKGFVSNQIVPPSGDGVAKKVKSMGIDFFVTTPRKMEF
jgi:hypothetical protein